MAATGRRDEPLRGIFFICLAMALIACQEAMAKYLGQYLPMLQVIGARYFGHFLLMAAVLMPRHGLGVLRAKRPLVQVGRSVLLLIDTSLFFFSLTLIGLAEATAIFFTVPLLVVILSVVLLGEKHGPRRFLAVLTGLIGMLVITRPGSGVIGYGALLTLAAAFCVSLFNIITRKLADEDPIAVTMFYTALAGAVIMLLIVPFAWESPEGWRQWAALLTIGIAGGAAHSCIIASHFFAPASTVAPFMYSQIFWAVGFGFLLFGALPDRYTVLGGLIIIGSGIYLLQQQKVKADFAV